VVAIASAENTLIYEELWISMTKLKVALSGPLLAKAQELRARLRERDGRENCTTYLAWAGMEAVGHRSANGSWRQAKPAHGLRHLRSLEGEGAQRTASRRMLRCAIRECAALSAYQIRVTSAPPDQSLLDAALGGP